MLHAAALHDNPNDSHTLGPVVAAIEQLTSVEARRIHVDKGHRGDRANAVLAAASYNFRLLIRWLEALLRALHMARLRAPLTAQAV